jgi:hypothetical protein
MYIHLYDSSANLISEGTGLAPLVVGPLNASNNEISAPIKLTAKCDSGYKTFGNTIISFVGTNASKWTVCATSGGTYASTLTVASLIDSVGTDLYVKAAATSDENPVNDTSVDVQVQATIQAV